MRLSLNLNLNLGSEDERRWAIILRFKIGKQQRTERERERERDESFGNVGLKAPCHALPCQDCTWNAHPSYLLAFDIKQRALVPYTRGSTHPSKRASSTPSST